MELLLRFVVAVEAIAESLAILAGGALQSAAAAPAADAAATPQKRSPGRPSTKGAADAKPDAAAPAADAKPSAAAPAAAAKAADPTFEYDTLKAAMVELANLSGEAKAAAVAILGSFGVKKASEAPAEKWPAMHAQVVAALEKFKAPADDSAGEGEFA